MSAGIGVQLPQTTNATAQGLLEAARAAETAGLDSLSVTERVIWPVAPVTLPDGTPGTPPAHQVTLFDPLETLTAVGAVTERIDLITAIIGILFQSPVILARRVATVDQFAAGRLYLGVGQAWMTEEFAATHVPRSRRGAGYAEHIAAMRALWAPDPVSFDGRFYQVPESYYGPKPVRPGGVPILAGATTQAGIDRAIGFADEWLPVISPTTTWEEVEAQLGALANAADDAGRPRLPVRLRAHSHVTERPLNGARGPASGSIEQLAEGLARLEALGVTELCLNQTQRGVPFDEQLDAAVHLKEIIG
ncbi:MAG: Luciferase-like monooxygenase [Chthonomonadaceae bacterium]|nr:Luciferase-like monooxygenase [Chthonomonadaceae bacterium]